MSNDARSRANTRRPAQIESQLLEVRHASITEDMPLLYRIVRSSNLELHGMEAYRMLHTYIELIKLDCQSLT